MCSHRRLQGIAITAPASSGSADDPSTIAVGTAHVRHVSTKVYRRTRCLDIKACRIGTARIGIGYGYDIGTGSRRGQNYFRGVLGRTFGAPVDIKGIVITETIDQIGSGTVGRPGADP